MYMPCQPQDQHGRVKYHISQIWCAATQIIEYLHDHVPNWDGWNTKRKPSSMSIKPYRHAVYAISTPGSALLRDAQNFADLMYINTYPWISLWPWTQLRRMKHQKKALIRLYKTVPIWCVCHVKPRNGIAAWTSKFRRSDVQQQKSLNISMTIYPIETDETPKESPDQAL